MRKPRAILVLAAAGACVSSLALATPAQASTTVLGCTVTPRTPTIVGYNFGGAYPVPIARYGATVSCVGNRTVSLNSIAYERDNGQPGDAGGDDLIDRHIFLPVSFGPSGGSVVRHWDRAVPNWDTPPDAYVELYHQVSFRVTAGGSTTAPTLWEKGPVLSTYALGWAGP